MQFYRPECKPSPIRPIVSGKAPQIATSAADKPLRLPSKNAVLNPETELRLLPATDVSVFQKKKIVDPLNPQFRQWREFSQILQLKIHGKMRSGTLASRFLDPFLQRFLTAQRTEANEHPLPGFPIQRKRPPPQCRNFLFRPHRRKQAVQTIDKGTRLNFNLPFPKNPTSGHTCPIPRICRPHPIINKNLLNHFSSIRNINHSHSSNPLHRSLDPFISSPKDAAMPPPNAQTESDSRLPPIEPATPEDRSAKFPSPSLQKPSAKKEAAQLPLPVGVSMRPIFR